MTPVMGPVMVPVMTPLMIPVMVPVMVPVMTPLVVPVMVPLMVMTPGDGPSNRLNPRVKARVYFFTGGFCSTDEEHWRFYIIIRLEQPHNEREEYKTSLH